MTTASACVLRDLFDGTGPQYVPLNEAVNVQPTEIAFVGAWRSMEENHGPSGSHRRTVCTPLGALTEMPVNRLRLANS